MFAAHAKETHKKENQLMVLRKLAQKFTRLILKRIENVHVTHIQVKRTNVNAGKKLKSSTEFPKKVIKLGLAIHQHWSHNI